MHQAVGTPANTRDFAHDFADFAANLTVGDLSPEVIAAVETNLSDTLACAIAGRSADGVGQVYQMVETWGGKPEASVWCSNLKVPAHHAAWINGVMAHARDYDDTHDGAVLHAGVSVIPAVLAAAELSRNATGADVLCGIAAGLELICRLGIATNVTIIQSGFIYTSLFGHFAATAAAARVLRLTPAQTANALGIAHSQAAGTHQVTRDAALTKRMQPGFAAKTGVLSATMSALGIKGTVHTFEGVDGLYRTHFNNQYDPAALRAYLGTRYELVNLSYKPYPCCRLTHSGIDAALQLHDKLKRRLGDIERIEARVNKQTYEAVCTPPELRAEPTSIVAAQFSLPYTIACALLNDGVGLNDFSRAAIDAGRTTPLSRRVVCVIDEAMEKTAGRGVSPTELVVHLKGETLRARVEEPKGSITRPLQDADVQAKLADCMKVSGIAWPADTPQVMAAAISGLPKADGPHALISAMTTR